MLFTFLEKKMVLLELDQLHQSLEHPTACLAANFRSVAIRAEAEQSPQHLNYSSPNIQVLSDFPDNWNQKIGLSWSGTPQMFLIK